MHDPASGGRSAGQRALQGQGNLQEGRHSLGRVIFHGKRGELRQRYNEGRKPDAGAQPNHLARAVSSGCSSVPDQAM
jgi:hypothetical protein